MFFGISGIEIFEFPVDHPCKIILILENPQDLGSISRHLCPLGLFVRILLYEPVIYSFERDIYILYRLLPEIPDGILLAFNLDILFIIEEGDEHQQASAF